MKSIYNGNNIIYILSKMTYETNAVISNHFYLNIIIANLGRYRLINFADCLIYLFKKISKMMYNTNTPIPYWYCYIPNTLLIKFFFRTKG